MKRTIRDRRIVALKNLMVQKAGYRNSLKVTIEPENREKANSQIERINSEIKTLETRIYIR